MQEGTDGFLPFKFLLSLFLFFSSQIYLERYWEGFWRKQGREIAKSHCTYKTNKAETRLRPTVRCEGRGKEEGESIPSISDSEAQSSCSFFSSSSSSSFSFPHSILSYFRANKKICGFLVRLRNSTSQHHFYFFQLRRKDWVLST